MKSQHTIFVALLWLMPITVFGQAASGLVQPDEPPETNIKISIAGVAPTRPALQHRLFPDRNEMIDRNATVYYHRAVFSLSLIRAGIRRLNLENPDSPFPTLDSHENYDIWMESPLDEMPVEAMRAWLNRHEDVFDDLSRARVSGDCDWGILPDRSEDIVPHNILMEEAQQMRSICRMLVVAIRVAAHDKDFELAIRHLQTGYKIAHDVSRIESFIASLVGVSCAIIMVDQQTMLMQQPGFPNLYWPLVDLPSPLTNVRSAFRNEIGWISGPRSIFRTQRDPESSTMDVAGWRAAIEHDIRLLNDYGGLGFDDTTLPLAALTLRGYPIAKQSLISSGMDFLKVEKMPVLQVISIHEKRSNQAFCDDLLKALNLPFQEMIIYLDNAEQDIENSFYKPDWGGETSFGQTSLIPVLPVMVPAMQQVVLAESRATRYLAGLRTIEAIRAHVAETGALPAKLESITVVPVPLNSDTGKAFEYRLTNGGAELKVVGDNRYTNKNYQIQLVK